MDAMKIANSIPMWIACGIPVILVIAQALIFAKKSYSAGKKIGLTEKQMKNAIKSSAITSIGPSIVILSGMLSLLITVGGPMAWMRLSLIGSVMFESIAAGFGTASVGVQLGADTLTPLALDMAVWTMILGSIGWIIFATISANRMDKVQHKISGGDPAKLMAISSAAIIGAFSSMSSSHLIKLNKNSVACVLGAVFMAILLTISEKKEYQVAERMESYDFNSGSNDHHSRDLKEERTWKKKIFMKANICRRCIRLVNLPDCLELYYLSCRHLYWQLCTDFFQNLLHLPPHLFLQQVHSDFSGL